MVCVLNRLLAGLGDFELETLNRFPRTCRFWADVYNNPCKCATLQMIEGCSNHAGKDHGKLLAHLSFSLPNSDNCGTISDLASTEDVQQPEGGFLKLGVPYWGILIIRTILFWGLYWGPLFWETTRRLLACGRLAGANETCDPYTLDFPELGASLGAATSRYKSCTKTTAANDLEVSVYMGLFLDFL